jgi:tripartite-type tricarboxylate transporter receptor subunit TctC
MRQASKRIPESAEKTVRDIRRATRRHHSAEEKIRVTVTSEPGKISASISRAAPVASIYRGAAVLVVHPSFPAKSVPELIAYGKSNPGQINMASGGVGSAQHVYGE